MPSDLEANKPLHDLLKAQQSCLICLEDWANCGTGESTLLNRLLPCKHLECNECFLSYHKENGKLQCPLC